MICGGLTDNKYLEQHALLLKLLHLCCQEKIFLLCAFNHDLWHDILRTYEGTGTVHLFLVFVGFTIRCTLLYNYFMYSIYYISIMTNSISYRLVDLVWIDRMHNK